MLVLIIILNWEQFADKNQQPSLIVKEGEYIIGLSINGVVLEQAGPQWRVSSRGVQPETVLLQEQIDSLIASWQNAFVEPIDLEFDQALFSDPQVIVEVKIAGSANNLVIAMFIIEEQLYFVIEKQVYSLRSPSIQSLLQPIITVKQ